MSQWGEIEDINLVREKSTNKSMGFAFVKYEDQRSTILAVDNFNGIKLLGRTLRCDHCEKYKLPKEIRKREEDELEENPDKEVSIGPGHAYAQAELANNFDILHGQDVWSAPLDKKKVKEYDLLDDEDYSNNGIKKSKKHKKEEKKKRKHEKADESSKKIRSNYSTDDAQNDDKDFNIQSNNLKGNDYAKEFSNQKTISEQQEFENVLRQQTPVDIQMNGINAAGAYCSWRGKRDPTVAVAADAEKRKQMNMEKYGEQVKRGEFTGFGGMQRRR